MDYEWAEQVLVAWVKDASALMAAAHTRLVSQQPQLDALLLREDQTRRVVAKVNGISKLPSLVARFKEYYILDDGVHTANYALGRLRTDTETREKLGSVSPQMSANALHPTVWGAASELWADGHHESAVQRAATFINADVQDRVNRHDVSDAALMNEAFSSAPPAIGKPRLKWPGADADLTVKSMREGVRGYATGCFQAIRNPSTHNTEQSGRQVALEQLAALSLLARWIEQCELVEVTAG